MNKRIKNIIPLSETKFLNLYDAEYENKRGKEKHWIIASRKDIDALRKQIFDGKKEKLDAVAIVALHRDSMKLVLVRQYRVPVNDYVYEIPAGLVDDEEDLLTTAKRELFEETGLKLLEIDKTKNVLPLYASAGMTDESVALVYCLCEGETSTQNLEEDEDLEVLLISKDEASELLNMGKRMDVKTYLVLQSFIKLGEGIIG